MIGLFLVALEQVIKFFIIRYFPRLVVENRGLAFGSFENTTESLYAVSIIIFIIFIWFYPRFWSLVIIASGVIGNLIDRIARGYVVDYINLGFWPAFNLADILIVLGAIIYGYQIFRHIKRRSNSEARM